MKTQINFALVALMIATLGSGVSRADKASIRIGEGSFSISVYKSDSDKDDSDETSSAIATLDSDAEGTSSEDLGNTPSKASNELSVPPMDHITYPKARPDWVQRGRIDASGKISSKVRIVVVGAPSESQDMADENAAVIALTALETHTRDSVEFVPFNFDVSQIGDFKQFIEKEYRGTLEKGGSTYYETAYVLELSRRDSYKLRRAITNSELEGRLAFLTVSGFGGAAMLLASGSVLGFASRRAERKQAQKAAA